MPHLTWSTHDASAEIANTSLGPYMVEKDDETYFRIWLPDEHRRSSIRRGGYVSLAVAKATCERLYQLRLAEGVIQPSDAQFQPVVDTTWRMVDIPGDEQHYAVQSGDEIIATGLNYDEALLIESGPELVFAPPTTSPHDLMYFSGPCTLVRQLTSAEADVSVGPMFEIRFEDGALQHAFIDELKQKPLAQPNTNTIAMPLVVDSLMLSQALDTITSNFIQGVFGTVMSPPDHFTDNECEAAQCLMEAVVEVCIGLDQNGTMLDTDWKVQLGKWFEDRGAFEVRRRCREWAKVIEPVWQGMPDEWKDWVVYDYEFMPLMLELINWSSDHPDLPPAETIKTIIADYKGSLR